MLTATQAWKYIARLNEKERIKVFNLMDAFIRCGCDDDKAARNVASHHKAMAESTERLSRMIVD